MTTVDTVLVVALIVVSFWVVQRIYIGELMALLYVALVREGPCHALGLQERIARRAAMTGAEGSVTPEFSLGLGYTALRRLERLGFVESWDDYTDLPAARGGRPRRMYRVRGTG